MDFDNTIRSGTVRLHFQLLPTGNPLGGYLYLFLGLFLLKNWVSYHVTIISLYESPRSPCARPMIVKNRKTLPELRGTPLTIGQLPNRVIVVLLHVAHYDI